MYVYIYDACCLIIHYVYTLIWHMVVDQVHSWMTLLTMIPLFSSVIFTHFPDMKQHLCPAETKSSKIFALKAASNMAVATDSADLEVDPPRTSSIDDTAVKFEARDVWCICCQRTNALCHSAFAVKEWIVDVQVTTVGEMLLSTMLRSKLKAGCHSPAAPQQLMVAL